MGDETRLDKIGRYEIEDELGRGGMATVYKACDPLFEREVAVKILPRAMLHDPKFRARFEREGKLVARLEHNAIVPVYDFGEQDGQPYIVMRLMTGGDLSGRITSGRITREEAGRILVRLSDGLDVAHANGVIHRDLKPGNILFDSYGDAYLSDFGIARMIESNATLTGSGIIGTPAYMSPEQIQGEKDLDGRSDIYSLGVILYLMLSGEMPFAGDTPGKVMMKHILDPVPDISLKHPDILPAVSAVLKKALAKDPDERYQTAKDMASAYADAALSDQRTQASRTDSQGLLASLYNAITDDKEASAKEVSADAPTAFHPDSATRATADKATATGPTAVQQESPAPGEAAGQDAPSTVAASAIAAGATQGASTSPDVASAKTNVQAAHSVPATAPAAAQTQPEPTDPASEAGELDSIQPQPVSSGSPPQKRAGAWKWAFPVVALLLVIAVAGFFVFSGGASMANSPGSGAVETPTKSSPIGTEAVSLTGALAPTDTSQPPTATTAPTQTPIPASPTPSEEATLTAGAEETAGAEATESSAATPEATAEVTSQADAGPSPADVEAFMGSANILVFEDIVSEYELPYVKETLDDMGLTYKWDGNAQGRILADLASGPAEGGAWDLVIVAMETRENSSSEVIPYINAALDQGIAVILETWNLDQATSEASREFLETCGVTVKEYLPNQGSALELIVYPMIGATSHPVLSQPNTGMQFTNPDTRWLASRDLGDLVSLTGAGDAQILIGLDPTQNEQKGVLTSCLDGRLTLMTFSSHSFPYKTMAPLWENMIYNALKARMNYLN